MKRFNFCRYAGAAGVMLLAAGCFAPAAKPQPVPQIDREKQDMDLAAKMQRAPYARSLEIFRRYAAKGNAEAQYQLGKSYLHGGTGVERDVKQARRFFEQAAAKEHPLALNELGNIFLFGNGVEQNEATAIGYLRRSAKHNTGALLTLAVIYFDKKDTKEADRYFQLAIKQQIPQAKFLYAKSLYSAKRYSEAAKLLKELAPAEPEAEYLYALCLLNGHGVPVDTGKGSRLLEKHCRKFGDKISNAELLYFSAIENRLFDKSREVPFRQMQLAADLGYAPAQYDHALTMADKKEPGKALEYARRAAQQEYAEAVLLCGTIYKQQQRFQEAYNAFISALQYPLTKKRAVENLSSLLHYSMKREQEALRWDAIGVDLESIFCQNELAKDLAVRKDDASFARAAALFAHAYFSYNTETAGKNYTLMLEKHYDRLRMLADKGNMDALFAIAMSGMLEKGNDALVIELLQKAAKSGHVFSCNILGNLYYNGKMAPKNFQTSFEYFLQAARRGHRRSTSRAMYLLCRELLQKATKKQFDEICKLALKNDDPDAISEYACLLENTKQTAEATKYYRIAANNGNAFAMNRLYHILLKDDQQQARNYLLQALALNYQNAMLTFSEFAKSVGNPRLAFGYCLMAREYGDRDSAYAKMAEYYLAGYGCTKSTERFWRIANAAYKENSGAICYVLGKICEEGKIVRRNPAMARKYYTEGARRGNYDCKQKLQKK